MSFTKVTAAGIGTTGTITYTNVDVAGVITATSATFTGNVSVGGTLTYEDVTNVDSVGLITARNGIVINGGGLIVSGVTTVSAGTTSIPSISPSGDTNTGIFFPSPDTIAFGEGGSEAARIDSSGRFGLGTTSPAGVFHTKITTDRNLVFNTNIGGDARITALNDAASANVNFEIRGDNVILQSSGGAARVDSSGRLLVGTSSARANLYNGSEGGIFQVEGTSGTIQSLIGNANATGGNPSFVFGKSRGTSTGSTTVLQSGDLIGRISFQGADGTEFVQAADIYAEVDGTPGANDMPGRLVFSTTADGASSPTERMRIDSSGRMGLGKTSPNSTFEIYHASEPYIYLQNSTSGTSASDGFSIVLFGSDVYINNRESGNLLFYNNGSERARIDSSGRLLVGTTTSVTGGSTGQYARLQVVGNTGGNPGVIVAGNALGASSISSGATIGTLLFSDNAAGEYASVSCQADATGGTNDYPGRLVFSTTADGSSTPTERMRIDNLGRIFTYNANTGNNSLTVASAATAGTAVANFIGAYGATGVNTGTSSFIVWTNGNVQNTNNSYTAISDIKLKENIVDANSQWNDLKALKVRNYNLKEGQTHKQIGLIAQEVEPISPGLVYESPDRDAEGNDLGTVTKSVNYSVLYMKAVKALQEAMERIEQLEASNADLLTRVSALEST